MTERLRRLLSTGLINRYGERERFEALCRTLAAAVEEDTENKFIIDVHNGLQDFVNKATPVATLLRNWVDSIKGLAEKHEVDASEFLTTWEPIAMMYESMEEMLVENDPTKIAGALLGVKFTDPETEAKAEAHRIEDAKIVGAALTSLKERFTNGGVNYVIDTYLDASRVPSTYEFLAESIIDKDVLSKLKMEYDRFAKGPEAVMIANDPMAVEFFDEAKRQLDSALASHFWHVSEALRTVDWTHSMMGESYWQQQIQRYESVR